MPKKDKKNSTLLSRPPIITVLGHVDHGKTTLLDKIRKTNLVSKEYGSMTQHIGAYQVEANNQKITFIDTPGHEAFAKMRQRGAKVADIAILVVAGNDGVKPQTIESIDHIKAAKIPCIVALNKIDLPDINLEKIKKQLVKNGLNLEEFGGEIPFVPLSATTGKGIDKLLEMIVLISELNNVGKQGDGKTKGVVIESSLSKNKGIVASIVLSSGKLEVKDEVVSDNQEFRIRAIHNWKGEKLQKISAGDPAEIIGWEQAPIVGSMLFLKNETQLKRIEKSELVKKEKKQITKTDASKLIEEEKINIILKADTAGSLEAITSGISDQVTIVSKNVGNIKESDILLAKTTNAIVIGFNMKITDSISQLASSEKVMIKTYSVIYKLFEELDEVIKAIKQGSFDNIIGKAKIIALFDIKGEKIAGVKVISGRIAKGDKVKVLDNNTEVGQAHIKSLKHHKKDITKAEKGMEAGILLSKKLDLSIGYSIIAIG